MKISIPISLTEGFKPAPHNIANSQKESLLFVHYKDCLQTEEGCRLVF